MGYMLVDLMELFNSNKICIYIVNVPPPPLRPHDCQTISMTLVASCTNFSLFHGMNSTFQTVITAGTMVQTHFCDVFYLYYSYKYQQSSNCSAKMLNETMCGSKLYI